ncbi:OLC1v1011375C1 [Oldenlandia corymbosa var. corymbosa]|uniref:OLC1v1011375C1 n=1 Tax=Oldenlandia corymbosa var. corymbosa TaxID=529605 RepID=A0AAV1DWI0_OLDCO|nr:OLC1v1011375C1 [Oldenlandia corymbosa var. corymbosa]
MARMAERKFPVDAKDYKLYEEVGEGVSATVYRALCIPLNEVVAIKVLDLEKCNNDLDGIRREVQTMCLIDHPNVLRAYCSFTTGHHLWVVMPYMAGGSCLHIIKTAYPDGFEEPVIATLLREVLKALVYLHAQGHIHRDVKAGNILIDTNGTIKLADFGVAACMFDTGDRQRSRNTFVGTPCWMAPEVMQQLHGYDFKADIWSFGITALELAHGHAPFSKYPPMKVLLMTLQNAPPGLDYERDKRFSKSFREIVAACLVKDPKKRPSSEKLLKHPFFKHAKSNEYLTRTILEGLPPLGDRFRMLKAKEADFLVQNKSLYEDKEHLSQQEYIRGISAWNFNLEDLKNQAALIPDSDVVSNADVPSTSGKPRDGNNDIASPSESQSPEPDRLPSPDRPSSNSGGHMEGSINDIHDLEDSLAAFPMKPLQALKGCFDVCEDDSGTGSPHSNDAIQSDIEHPQVQSLRKVENLESRKDDGENAGQNSSLPRAAVAGHKKPFSSSLMQDNVLSPKKFLGDGDREYLQPKYTPERNHSGPLQYRQKKEIVSNTAGDDLSEGAVVQRKGRFKVTAGDGPINSFFGGVSGGSPIPSHSSLSASILPSLQCILQQNSMQREELIKLIKYVEQSSGPVESVETGANDILQIPATTSRERELQSQVIQLQQR